VKAATRLGVRLYVKVTKREAARIEACWIHEHADDFSAWARVVFRERCDKVLGPEPPPKR
jgi:hypothetical protein